ncbi:MAG TPA: polysaccharide deacetylase family protein [Solirubrobacteraceae bacterium]|nr:polysaccharide deacetylase family protein [Solirubrobacteraceae bacterium]
MPERFGYLSEEEARQLARRRAGVTRARQVRRRRRVAVAGLVSVALLIWALLGVWPSGGSQSDRLSAPRPARLQAAAAPHPSAPPAPSRGRAGQPRVAAGPALDRAGRRRREIALTFDDGPSPYTAAVVRVLRRWHAAATFFEIGTKVQTAPGTVAAQIRYGFAVEDHTVNHSDLSGLPAGAQAAEIRGAAKRLHRAGAPPPQLFRPPYGRFDGTTVATARSMGMRTVLWTIDSEDYLRPGTAAIVRKVLRATVPGAIVLMHDGGGDRAQTVAALSKLIPRLRRRHYRLVTVAQLLHDNPPPRGRIVVRTKGGG